MGGSGPDPRRNSAEDERRCVNRVSAAATSGGVEPQLAEAELRLPRAPGVFRRWLAAHPRAVDWVIVGSYLFGCAAVLALEMLAGRFAAELSEVDAAAAEQLANRADYAQWPWPLVTLLIIAITAVALRFRRRAPFAGVVVVSVLLVFEQGMLVFPTSVALFFLLFAVPIYRSVAAGWLAFGLSAGLSILVVQLTGGANSGLIAPSGIVLAEGPFGIGDRIAVNSLNTLWMLVILMVGINFGNRRRYVAALIDRVHQLAREREQRAQLAVAAERARIAREMHDVVAHSLSVMVTLSEASSVAITTQPEAAQQAMLRSSETGRQALIEMRRLLGVLGDDRAPEVLPTTVGRSAPRAPQPNIAQLPDLIAGFVDAGLRVTVTETGVPRGDATQQLAVFRIVQEALTNVLRHAGAGAIVQVLLTHEADLTRIEVIDGGTTNAGRAGAAGDGARAAGAWADGGEAPEIGRAIPGSGRGLTGASERARMFGGFLEAGPRGPGWRVLAEVPVNGAGTNHESGSTATLPEPTPAAEPSKPQEDDER